MGQIIFYLCFRFHQHTIINEDLGAAQSTLLSCLSDSPHSDHTLLSNFRANCLLQRLDRGKNY